MKSNIANSGRKMRRGVVAAVVLGTALSGLGASVPQSLAAAPDLQAVNDIGRYCAACWRNARLDPDCWGDCTQDVFVRLLERLEPDAWDRVLQGDGDERREFLRAVDAVKKRTQRRHKYAGLPNDDLAVQRPLDPRRDDLTVVNEAASDVLTSRQQHILRLSFEGASVHEIADELSLAAERVSDEKYKAIRKLREHLGVTDGGQAD